MLNLKEWVIITEGALDNFSIIRIIKGKFSGVEYAYREVKVSENDAKTSATLSFEYIVLAGTIDDCVDEFKQFAGDVLTAKLYEQLDNGTVVYYGGR